VLTDPVTSCEDGRARLLSGFAAGAICALAGAQALAALPFAVLALNALGAGARCLALAPPPIGRGP
jgi:hypothetical protein